MDKRFQVFLSSTYEDLKAERLEVMKAILELDCIPCGMEYFPAASEDQWTYIKELIDQCDYYVVIVANRYGSTAPDGTSYTQKEYEYAVSQGVPAIAFLHSDPGSIASKLSEEKSEGKKKLKEFQNVLKSKLCKEWSSVHELGAVVSRSLTQLIKRNPRPGWVRAEGLASAEASNEILRLKQQVEEQEKELNRLQLKAPAGAETLAQGSDKYQIEYKLRLIDPQKGYRSPDRASELFLSSSFSWDEIFSSFATYLLVECKEAEIKSAINKMLRVISEASLGSKYPKQNISSALITEECLQTIKVQCSALGLIELRMVMLEHDLTRMCQLTPLGEHYLIKIRAIKRSKRKKV